MKRITIVTAAVFAALTLISCKGKSEKNPAQTSQPAQSSQNAQPAATGMAAAFLKSAEKTEMEEKAAEAEVQSYEQKEPLYETTARHGFKMGAVISYSDALKASYTDMIKENFNSITASNEFKAYSLLNQAASMKNENGMPAMNYSQADTIAKFAQENGIGIRGHVLVWDAYMPVWFFKEGYKNDGAFVDSETMKKRLAYYIDEVVSHFEINFPGVVYCWDVVNEAVADGTNECKADDERRVRTSRGGTTNYFYDVIGPDYVELAFKYARKAVNTVNPDIRLFYNDYNTFYSPKKEAIGKLLASINKNEKLCDGLGMQGYVGGYGQQAGCMNPNDIKLFSEAIRFYGEMGLEVHVTELALRNYEKDQAAKHEDFYESFFRMLAASNSENTYLTSVSIWGLIDNPNMSKNDYSYKMNGPYCGIYQYSLWKKPEFYRIIKALE